MKKSIEFLKKIKRNNNTVWMHAHKEQYLAAKDEFEFLVQELIVRIGEWDSRIPFREPKECVFRFNRDTRFSKNKSPYKENFGAYISYGGKKADRPGYYLHLSPKEIFVAGGLWMPKADALTSARRYIMEEGTDLQKILKDKKFKKTFSGLTNDDLLKRPPRGFSADHEYADFFKFKSFTVSAPMTLAQALKPGFGKLIDQRFKLMKPFNHFLDMASTKGMTKLRIV